jgi:hypothetical protein
MTALHAMKAYVDRLAADKRSFILPKRARKGGNTAGGAPASMKLSSRVKKRSISGFPSVPLASSSATKNSSATSESVASDQPWMSIALSSGVIVESPFNLSVGCMKPLAGHPMLSGGGAGRKRPSNSPAASISLRVAEAGQ